MANSKISELNSAIIINNADLLPIVQSGETKKATFNVLKSSIGDFISSLNGLVSNSQSLATGSAGVDFNISSIGTTHTFNIPDASTSSRGLISSSDFTTFNNKQNQLNGIGFVVANGTTISYDTNTYLTTAVTSLNGLTTSSQLFATGTSGTDLNISSSSNTHTINIPNASASARGLLTASDFSTFSNKQNQLNGTGFVKANGTTISYDNTSYLTTAITSLNSLTTASQTFSIGTSGSDYNISSSSGVHTFNLPSASATTRGALTAADFTTFSNKQNQLNGTGFIKANGTTISYDNSTYLTSAILNFNGLTTSTQYLATGTGGSDFNISSVGNTHTFNLPTASATKRGLLSTTDFVVFNSKQDAITLTTTGTGAATLIGSTLNIPDYSSSGGGVTNVTASSPLSSTGGTTPNISITLAAANSSTIGAATFRQSDFNDNGAGEISIDYANGSTASSLANGFLSKTDWITFNGKQSAITLTTTGSSGAATLVGSTLNIPQYSGGSGTAVDIQSAFSALGSGMKGFNIPNPSLATNSTNNPASGTINWVAYYLPQAVTITGVKWWQSAVGNYTANNYNGVALYSYSAGTATLVASSTNDGTVFQQAGANSWKTKAFSSTYSASAGIYYIAFLWSSSVTTTAPTFGVTNSNTSSNVTLYDFTNSAKLAFIQTGVTALPSTQSLNALSGTSQIFSIYLY